MAEPSPYAVLGVARGCTPADIRRAYRAKAKALHPDVSRAAGAADAFARLQRAYEILNDPAARARLDELETARSDASETRSSAAHYAWINIASPAPGTRTDSSRSRKRSAAADDQAFEELYLAMFQTRIDAAKRSQKQPQGKQPKRAKA